MSDSANKIFKRLLCVGPVERSRALADLESRRPDVAAAVRALLVEHEASEAETVAEPSRPTGRSDSASDAFASTLAAYSPGEAGPPINGGETRGQIGLPQIPGYAIRRKLGRGGMGVVYLADEQRAGVRVKVALKLLAPEAGGRAATARFERERRILASMQHDSIARLFGSGVTGDGAPYFSMEYVEEGLPVDQFCDRNNMALNDRLRLFVQICDAVQYAHNGQVLHRDLKPANILVTRDGRPKLLDFGIATFTNPLLSGMEETITAGSRTPMTADYASPEQIRGDDVIGAASDVYSLGVILFELLSGHKPYELKTRSPAELQSVVLDGNPRRPSDLVSLAPTVPRGGGSSSVTRDADTISRHRSRRPGQLRRDLEGDLDNIVLKAIRKEPERRYPTVHALASDIEGFLAGMPVSAQPDTLRYRTGKFVRRHRGAVGMTLVAAIGLVSGLVLAAVAWRNSVSSERNAVAAQAIAVDQLEAGLDLNQFIVEDVERKLAYVVSAKPLRRVILDRTSASLRAMEEAIGIAGIADFDETHARLELQLAQSLRRSGDLAGSPRAESFGDLSAALRLYREAGEWLGAVSRRDLKRELSRRVANEEALLARNQGLVHLELAIAGGDESSLQKKSALEQFEAAVGTLERALESGLGSRTDLDFGTTLFAIYMDVYKLHHIFGESDQADEAGIKADAVLDELLAVHPGDMNLLRDQWIRVVTKFSHASASLNPDAMEVEAAEMLRIARQRFDAGATAQTMRDLSQSERTLSQALHWKVLDVIDANGRGAVSDVNSADLRRLREEAESLADTAAARSISLVDLHGGSDRDTIEMIECLIHAISVRSPRDQGKPGLYRRDPAWAYLATCASSLADLEDEDRSRFVHAPIILAKAAGEIVGVGENAAENRGEIGLMVDELDAALSRLGDWGFADQVRVAVLRHHVEWLFEFNSGEVVRRNALIEEAILAAESVVKSATSAMRDGALEGDLADARLALAETLETFVFVNGYNESDSMVANRLIRTRGLVDQLGSSDLPENENRDVRLNRLQARLHQGVEGGRESLRRATEELILPKF